MLVKKSHKAKKSVARRKSLCSRRRNVSCKYLFPYNLQFCLCLNVTKGSILLSDNFVISSYSYRMTVIKNLPQLQKLDNVMVQPDEVGEAMRRGVELVHPHDRPIPGQMVYENNYGPASYQVRIYIKCV